MGTLIPIPIPIPLSPQMRTQIPFGSPVGNPCGIGSRGNGYNIIRPNNGDIFALCISVSPTIYSSRIKIKCRYRYRYWVCPTKCHSTKKHRACLEKNSPPPVDDGPKKDPNITPNFKNRIQDLRPARGLLYSSATGPFHDGHPYQFDIKLNWDPYEDLFGVSTDMEPRNIKFSRPEPRSWFGPNGQYVKELPCPGCRGRGYMLCSECGMDRSRPACTQCHGKGLMTCLQCLGECVVWEESINELPWEKALSSSPLNIVEDDEIDKLEIDLVPETKSKRIYASPPPEVGAKISRTLKNLNAVTGIFSKRMKKVHSDPILHAQRVEAMKRAKRTAAARQHISETLKVFFSNPENRLKRSLSMKGVKIHCKNCGQEGHRRHYCPSLKDEIGKSWYTCRICGQTGHNRQTCRQNKENIKHINYSKRYSCGICGEAGHNSRTCPQNNLTKRYSGQQKEQKLRIPTSTSLESNVKREKRTAVARQHISETRKDFFSIPENQLNHSLSLTCESKHQKGESNQSKNYLQELWSKGLLDTLLSFERCNWQDLVYLQDMKANWSQP